MADFTPLSTLSFISISICHQDKSPHMGQHWLVIFEPNLLGKQRFLSQPTSIVEFEQTKWPQQLQSHNDGQLIQLLHLSQVPRDRALIFSQSSISSSTPIFPLLLISPHHNSTQLLPLQRRGFLHYVEVCLEVKTQHLFLLSEQTLKHCCNLYFVYCRFSLGVRDVVKADSFLQTHQFHQSLLVITGASWEQLGEDNDWLEQRRWGARQRTRPPHDGKEQQRKQMLPQMTQWRGERERERKRRQMSLRSSVSPAVNWLFCVRLFDAGKKGQRSHLHGRKGWGRGHGGDAKRSTRRSHAD